jgi:ASC-1-like (ASCH) protein
MARTIRKKCWSEFFEAVRSGKKRFDVRLADFRCKPGDFLVLEEWNPKTRQYTGRELKRKISFVLKTNELGFWSQKEIQEKGLLVLSLE